MTPKTRSGVRRLLRRLSKTHAVELEATTHADEIGEAFNRFLAVDDRSWKKTDGSTLRNDLPQRRAILASLLHLARQDRTVIHFLRVEGVDIAAQLYIMVDGQLQLLKTSFDDAWANYGAGKLLLAETIRLWCAGACGEHGHRAPLAPPMETALHPDPPPVAVRPRHPRRRGTATRRAPTRERQATSARNRPRRPCSRTVPTGRPQMTPHSTSDQTTEGPWLVPAARRVLAFHLGITAVLVAINLSPLIDSWTVRAMFHLDAESNVAVWFSSTSLLLLAAIALDLATRHRRGTIAWGLVAEMFASSRSTRPPRSTNSSDSSSAHVWATLQEFPGSTPGSCCSHPSDWSPH